jgi:hypothetical protein
MMAALFESGSESESEFEGFPAIDDQPVPNIDYGSDISISDINDSDIDWSEDEENLISDNDSGDSDVNIRGPRGIAGRESVYMIGLLLYNLHSNVE